MQYWVYIWCVEKIIFLTKIKELKILFVANFILNLFPNIKESNFSYLYYHQNLRNTQKFNFKILYIIHESILFHFFFWILHPIFWKKKIISHIVRKATHSFLSRNKEATYLSHNVCIAFSKRAKFIPYSKYFIRYRGNRICYDERKKEREGNARKAFSSNIFFRFPRMISIARWWQ